MMSAYRGLGVVYYPEHWDPSLWENDVDRMLELGLDTVRIAEFAWALLEPRENEFNIGYFDAFVEMCHSKGMKVIFGTPTATPPKWLTHNYPEVLNRDRNGHPFVGPRRHYTYNSPKYQEFCDRIVTLLAQHYGKMPGIVGWQIDNELNCEIAEFFSEGDHNAFLAYLRSKYKTLEQLNRALGTTFWSHTYSDWDQLRLEGMNLHDSPNPHLALEQRKFFSDSAIRFLKSQTAILRPHLAEGVFITTNGLFENLNYNELLEAGLDFITFDSYPNFANDINNDKPIKSLELEADAPLRDRAWSWNLAWTRSISPTFGIMEQQAGAHGWTTRMEAPAPKPGQMRLWTMQSVAHGADFVSYFRWRTSPMGNEIYWHGLNDYSNQPNRRLKELGAIAAEWPALKPIAGAVYEASVAVLKDYPNEFDEAVDLWHGRIARHSGDSWFRATQLSHTPCDFVYVGAASLEILQKYKVIAYPHAAIMTQQVSELLHQYVENGGTLILGARTGYKDETGLCPMRPMPGLVSDWVGVEVDDYTLVDREIPEQALTWDGAVIPAPVFSETLRATKEDVELLGSFTADYYAGSPGLARRRVGEGTVYYVGAAFSPAMVNALLRAVGVESPYAGLLPDLDPGFEVAVRSNGRDRWMFVLNYDGVERSFDLARPVTNLLTGETLEGRVTSPPYGVQVMRL